MAAHRLPHPGGARRRGGSPRGEDTGRPARVAEAGPRPARQTGRGTGLVGAPRMSGRVEIEYCTQCRWLPRAAWLAQELLTTFETELTELALKPGKGGIF